MNKDYKNSVWIIEEGKASWRFVTFSGSKIIGLFRRRKVTNIFQIIDTIFTYIYGIF
jgi:hypothetical protein